MKCLYLTNWPPFLYLCIVSEWHLFHALEAVLFQLWVFSYSYTFSSFRWTVSITTLQLLSLSINWLNNEWKCCNSDIAPETQGTNDTSFWSSLLARSLSMHAVCFGEHKIQYSISDWLSERHALMPFSLIGYFQQNMVKCEHVNKFFD